MSVSLNIGVSCLLNKYFADVFHATLRTSLALVFIYYQYESAVKLMELHRVFVFH
jgi:hypothetical protein